MVHAGKGEENDFAQLSFSTLPDQGLVGFEIRARSNQPQPTQ